MATSKEVAASRPPQPTPAPAPPADDGRDEIKQVAARNAPAFLISSVVHMVILILLGLWFLPLKLPEFVHLELVNSEVEGDQLDEEPLLIADDSQAALEEILTPDDLTPVDDPFAAPPKLELTPDGSTASSDIQAPVIGLALDGREAGSREALLGAYGGTGKTEGAVQLALAWLAKQQRPDGSWSLRGPYSDGAGVENVASATAMALLAFQGNGNTHQKGKYKENVDRGIKFLLSLQGEDGNFYHGGPYTHALYTHGQCTIVICELYGMTRDGRFKKPAERAVAYCCRAQDKNLGGWKYNPGDYSDTSVTGWVLMGLQSARMAGLDVPAETLARVHKYLDAAQAEGGSRYAYEPGKEPTVVMTAEGLLCRQYLGWPQNDERLDRGTEYLVQLENLPKWEDRNVYYWYYATQVLHHLEGPRWEKWNNVMRELLPAKQEKSGAEAGSWHPTAGEPDRWGFQGGRLFVTCLSVYVLEVYYRHMPLYSSGRMTAAN
ncbi:MAG: terpene cyclase/mutase family protein [Planctomycetaceae bacterium]|nr:terpene cyclase/mutase family protein [Planctomycetaceae bacterium]